MSDLPQYKKLQHLIKKQILSGVYKEGDLLPSENELSTIHELNRATVRQALSELVKDGYIYKHKGKGSIVSSRRQTLGLLSFKGFSEVVGQTTHAIKNKELKKPYLTKWDDQFFYELTDIEKAAGCICLERLRMVDEDPVMLEFTYIPNLNLPRFVSKPLINNSLFDTLLNNYQIEVINLEQDIRAIAADEEIAGLLQTEEESPILHIFRRYRTNRDGLFIYSSLYCNTEQYSIGSIFN
ncbi:GntR family transcriptional regulator [Flexithrix dorotheae]|uniref:GntR family transcriptional regulator n=1 Tax=Flexithrix dorotheae TaxID=70993 RepID=UPI00037A95BC|nr:GntR family transcriptional regulator [Flexithrix dorotheae]